MRRTDAAGEQRRTAPDLETAAQPALTRLGRRTFPFGALNVLSFLDVSAPLPSTFFAENVMLEQGYAI